jgi:hypothetical protein
VLYLRDRDPVDGHSKFDEALWLINDNMIHGSNKVKIKKKKPTQLSTLNPQPHPRHSTPKGYPQKNGH